MAEHDHDLLERLERLAGEYHPACNDDVARRSHLHQAAQRIRELQRLLDVQQRTIVLPTTPTPGTEITIRLGSNGEIDNYG